MTELVELSAEIHWLTTNEALADACQGWLCCGHLVVDTEFVRRKTFYPIPALIQCFDGHTVYMIDPLPITDWQPLADVLVAPGVLKVFHACSEDLEVFARLCDIIATPVFDTQIASALMGKRPSMGYNTLVQEICDIDLPKDETNSDWLQRPLTTRQIDYAAHDVYYLHQAFHELLAATTAKGRAEWVLEDSAAFGSNLSSLIAPEDYYLKLKGAWKLNQRQLAIARALCAWREDKVRIMDKPRSWVVKDQALLAMAKIQPRFVEELGKIDGLPEGVIRKNGKELLDLIARWQEAPASDLPALLEPPLNTSHKQVMASFKDKAQQCADEMGLAVEVLLSKKDMTRIIQDRLKGETGELTLAEWRKPLIEPIVEQVFAQ